MTSLTEAEVKEIITEFMHTRGVEVYEIPIANKRNQPKQPDFEFRCGGECSIVELKQREAEWFLTPEQAKAFEDGEIVHKSESMGFHKTFAERIEYGIDQIATYRQARQAFRLVWYFAHGLQSDIAAQRIKTTLLGDELVLELGSERNWRAVFFSDSIFQKNQDSIDGVFVSRLEGDEMYIELVLNPLSPSYPQFCCSEIAKAFGDGIYDPKALETAGKILIVDQTADRSSERGTLNWLGDKYGINVPQILRMGHTAAAVRPKKANEQP
jgi:hypothetical protein